MLAKKYQTNLSNFDGADLANGFYSMEYDYEERKVARYDSKKTNIIVSTVFATDTRYYETALIDKECSFGCVHIVSEYKTKQEAKKGHNHWVRLLREKKLPKEIKDIHSGEIIKLIKKEKKC